MQVCKNGKGGVCVCSVTAMTLSPHCSSAVIPESTDPQRVKDPSNSGNTEALSDKAFQQSQQLTGTVAVSVWCMVKQLLCPFPPPQSAFFICVVKTCFQGNQICTQIWQCFQTLPYISGKSAHMLSSRALILEKLNWKKKSYSLLKRDSGVLLVRRSYRHLQVT